MIACDTWCDTWCMKRLVLSTTTGMKMDMVDMEIDVDTPRQSSNRRHESRVTCDVCHVSYGVKGSGVKGSGVE